MAIQIPDSLYSAGNVKLDSTPSVNFYRQIEAERRAKQDAIDDYMRGLRGKITPAGMAVNDIPAFDTMRKKWQEFGIQHRDRIARDPQARAEFESMAADLISLAERSKAKVKAGEPVIGMLSKKENADQIRPEWLAEYDKSMSPLMKQNPDGTLEWDYDRKDIDFNKPIWKPAEFDFLKRYSSWKSGAKPDVLVGTDKPYTDKQTGLVFFPKTEQYNKETIAQIARNAARDISENENDLLYYRDRLAGSIKLDEYQKLDNIHQKYFGTPIGKDKDAPKRLAAAEAAYAAEQEVRNLEPVSKLDYERRQDDKRINIMLNQGRGGTPETVVNDVFGTIYEAAKRAKQEGKPYLQVNLLPVDAQGLALDFVEKLTSKPVDQSKIKIIYGDDDRVGIYWANNNRFIGYLPRVGTNIKAQPDVRAKREVVSQGETPVRLPKNITDTRMQPKSKWDKYKSN